MKNRDKTILIKANAAIKLITEILMYKLKSIKRHA